MSVRCHLKAAAGDMIILPAGVCHRFTFEERAETLRLFEMCHLAPCRFSGLLT